MKLLVGVFFGRNVMPECKIFPEIPIASRESTQGDRGQGDYGCDLSYWLEDDEYLTHVDSTVKVVSSDTSIVEVLLSESNHYLTNGIAPGKGGIMRLLAKSHHSDPHFPMTIEIDGHQGTRRVIPFTISIIK